MALEIKKQENENTQGLVRRFSKRLQQSGILVKARKIRFRAEKESVQAKKKRALRKEVLRKRYQKLVKMGKAITVKKRKRR